MNPCSRYLSVLLVSGWALSSLVACVTSEGRVFTTEAAPEQALESRLQLARGYIGRQNWQEARRNLELAADIDADAAEIQEAFALLYQGIGEPELAEQHFRRALSRNRGFSRARNNYAAFLYQQQRFVEAERQLAIVVQDTHYESRSRAFLNLGLCRLRLGDQQAAERNFARALASDRGNAMALMELANIAYLRGQWDAGQRYYDRYRLLVAQQSARGLWLGWRLAGQQGDATAQADFVRSLRSLYPQSPEYRAYREVVGYGEF